MKLYELSAQYQQVAHLIEDDEIPSQVLADTLQGIEALIEDKGRALAVVWKNLDADVEALRAEEARLARKRKTLESRQEWLKAYLLHNMQRCAIARIEHPIITIKLVDNPPACIIDSEDNLPAWALETIITRKVRKAEVRRRLLEGEAVPGAHLETEQRVEIR